CGQRQRQNRQSNKQQNDPRKPARKLHRAGQDLPPFFPSWAENSWSILRAFWSFWASAVARILSTDSGSNCLPSTPAWAVERKQFRSMERVAESSTKINSTGSAGRCRASRKTVSRSHSASVFPSLLTADSTSSSSSIESLVATVLARRIVRASALGSGCESEFWPVRVLLMGCPPFRYPRLGASGRQGGQSELLESTHFESMCLRRLGKLAFTCKQPFTGVNTNHLS